MKPKIIDMELGVIYWQPYEDQVLLWNLCHPELNLNFMFTLSYEGME